jgi:hypothetical protein
LERTNVLIFEMLALAANRCFCLAKLKLPLGEIIALSKASAFRTGRPPHLLATAGGEAFPLLGIRRSAASQEHEAARKPLLA